MALNVILYVEDEESDVILVRYALRKAEINNPIQVVKDGEEALDYFSGRGAFADRQNHPLPKLVLLDLNLPRMDGKKVLRWIREQPSFANLPVLIYSSSNLPNDFDETKALGANEYIVKPSGIDKITETMKGINARWLQS
jgi:CheY-like chemotaxis protein